MRLHSVKLHIPNGSHLAVSELIRSRDCPTEDAIVAVRDRRHATLAILRAQDAAHEAMEFAPPIETGLPVRVDVPSWAAAVVLEVSGAKGLGLPNDKRETVTFWRPRGRAPGAWWQLLLGAA